jgi:alpha-D-xyloside xylohydrolase
MPGYLTFFAHFLKKIVYGQWLMGNYFVSLNPNYDHIRMKQLIIILAVLLVQTAQAQVAEVRPTQADGIRRIKVEAVTDKIIRVRATAENQFPQKQSLIVVPQEGKKIHSSIATEGNTITLTTKELRTAIDRTTGRISFYDKNGKLLLKEAQSGTSIKPFRVPEREIGVAQRPLSETELNGYTWQLTFDSPKEEAFYGLGQHQSGDMNYKGKNEDLFQYNTKVSTPFVVSNRGYGILWDSYSYCRFGKPEEYRQLGDVFQLTNKEGKTGCLTGTYAERGGRTISRDEDSIYFENSETIVNLPKGIRLQGANVTYEGTLLPSTDATYHFILYYAGYVRVTMNGREVVAQRWRTAWNPNAWKFDVPMRRGEKSALRIEWQPDGGTSYCGLRVAQPTTDEEQNRLSIWNEMSRDMDYYFIAGNDIDQVISGYRTLTGKAPILPKWALGFWQSRERYKTQDELVSTLQEFRNRQIPIDNIVQDWSYWEENQWGSHDFDHSRYPDPQKMLDDVHRLHGRFMISVWPKFYVNTDNYKALDSNGWMYHQAVKDNILDWIGRGYLGSFYDAYAPDARKMFWQQMDDHLYSKFNKGIDAWWMDASEPNVRDCTPMWYRKALCGPTALGTSTEYFNAYALVNAEAIYNGQRGVNPNQRVFLLTRSGFAGEQRYSTATWSGDIGTRWEDMRAQMTAGLNYQLAGLPFWGMDIGGFCVENRYVAAQQLFDRNGTENEDLKEWRELQTRWHQFGCFVPLYRTHGQWPLREVWNIAPETHPAYMSITWYHRLRYFLMPYIYSLAAKVHFDDYTMMRGLAMDYPTDPRVFDIGDQWMFGPALMACPVSEYKARSREVFFPQGGWYDFYSNKYIQGGQTLTVDAPYERIPVFVRAGSILPLGPQMQWSDEKPADLIHILVYEGADGQFTLYEDEGTNYNYEKGKYATITFTYDDTHRQLTISKRKGSFKGMLKERKFNIVFVKKGQPIPLDLDNPTNKQIIINSGITVHYKGQEKQINYK